GREVVYGVRGDGGGSTVWLAALDRATPPRELAKNGGFVSFGAHGDVFFVTQSDATSFFTRIREDGRRRGRVSDISPIYDRGGTSPDGEWAILFSPAASGVPGGTVAVPVHGGRPVRICSGLCWAWWSADGRFFYVFVYDETAPERTFVIPLAPGRVLP